jgi:hypothetical protein
MQKCICNIKEVFTTAPILTPWLPDCQITVEMDALDYAIVAILSITTLDSKLHPVAFHSHTMTTSELNYDTHNKELLTIFKVFMRWQQYLEGPKMPVDMVIDHKNLEYFCHNLCSCDTQTTY